MKACQIFWSFALLLICLPAAVALADDHIVQESSRTYMGRTTPPRPSEVWMGEDKVCIKDGVVIIITRYDLKKRWTIIVPLKKYLEEDLSAPSGPKPQEEKPFRIQEYGFNYEPSYGWTIKKAAETETLDGRKCRKIVAQGDADYAEEVREMWVSEDVPINFKRYYDLVTKPNLDAQWLKTYEEIPELKSGFVVKSVYTSEPPIAPTIVMVTKLVKVEIAPPPPNIYEVPEGMQKVKTREELYAR
ncbi:MAG: DUF4412 domain-containing protein [Candidatus Aminicenantes bacterium]|nr:DUF4412 domain-containing protein [Candidatus Aminicenantes bacterium]